MAGDADPRVHRRVLTKLQIAGGQITTWSSTIELDGNSAIAAVFGANIVTIGIACFHGAALARANMAAQRKLVAQAWHLKQLIPT